MDAGETKFVKVRVNASGRRIIGIVVYDTLYARFSDFLNSIDPFLVLKQEHGVLAVQKDAISYLESLEEQGTSRHAPTPGEFRRVELELHEHEGSLAGEIFFPEGTTLVDVLNDERRFLSLREISFSHSVERYHYLAVAKKAVVVLKAPRL